MPTSNTSVNPEAERFKSLGNDHYLRKEYGTAHRYYTEAIKADPTNAVYYANRAAVLHASKDYSEAALDCMKAVEMDPQYTKAWGRLGTVSQMVSNWPMAIDAFQRALKCIPKDTVCPTEMALRTHFTQGLETAKYYSSRDPWDLYEALIPFKQASGKPSCVGNIKFAYEDFKNGSTALSSVKVDSQSPLSGGRFLQQWSTADGHATRDLSNSLVCDSRMFHVKDIESFRDKLKMQSMVEKSHHNGWSITPTTDSSTRPSTKIKEEALQRLENGPFKPVGVALTMTLRSSIVNAFYRYQYLNDTQGATDILTEALDIMEWGQVKFQHIGVNDKGSVYDRTFVRGIQRLTLEIMQKAIATHGSGVKYTTKDVMKLATKVVVDVQADAVDAIEIIAATAEARLMGRYRTYWLYPKVTAVGALGWCYYQQALEISENDPEREIRSLKAADCYLEAAEETPEDDELYIDYLCKHLECLCTGKKPLKATLPVCKRIRLAMPAVLEIWGGPRFGDRLRKKFEKVTEFETKYRQRIAEGVCTLDTVTQSSFPQEQTPRPPKVVTDVAPRKPGTSKTANAVRRAKIRKLLSQVI